MSTSTHASSSRSKPLHTAKGRDYNHTASCWGKDKLWITFSLEKSEDSIISLPKQHQVKASCCTNLCSTCCTKQWDQALFSGMWSKDGVHRDLNNWCFPRGWMSCSPFGQHKGRCAASSQDWDCTSPKSSKKAISIIPLTYGETVITFSCQQPKHSRHLGENSRWNYSKNLLGVPGMGTAATPTWRERVWITHLESTRI